jgi:hypothetical protein
MTNGQTRASALLSRDIDIFPAKATWLGESVGKARVRLTRDNVLKIWVETTTFPHRATLVVSTYIDRVLTNTVGDNSIIRRKQVLAVQAYNDTIYSVTPSPGCGCGSALKSLSMSDLAGTISQPLPPAPQRVYDDMQAVLANHWPGVRVSER